MPPLSIMIKPASSLCNLRCEYCFYHNVSDMREVQSYGIMTVETADKLIEKALAFADGESISFTFQGGEPLMAGLRFYRHFVKSVDKKNRLKSPIYFSLQTNGTLINYEWAQFLHSNGFLVGLSLDGDCNNNRYRVDRELNSTFDRAMNAAKILSEHCVDYNILTVLTGSCADNIDDIYSFFKTQGFRYLQFIPCLRPFGDNSENELYMTEEQYGNFLITCFKRYCEDYKSGSYISIRYFDNLVWLYRGQPAEQCGLYGHCMHQFVAEANGNIYPCDFYCVDEWLLGNINDTETNFDTLAHSKRAIDFLKESLQIKAECRTCEYYSLCRGGGCKRNRADRDWCKAYKRFFRECLSMFKIFLN